ncbi:MAG: hypothetical protein ACJA04_000674 [Cellvibrionaceae bacterium]|jgi:hypothetical protein
MAIILETRKLRLHGRVRQSRFCLRRKITDLQLVCREPLVTVQAILINHNAGHILHSMLTLLPFSHNASASHRDQLQSVHFRNNLHVLSKDERVNRCANK